MEKILSVRAEKEAFVIYNPFGLKLFKLIEYTPI